MRKILTERGQKRRSLGAMAAMSFLNMTDPRGQSAAMRLGLAEWGFKALNLAHGLAKRSGLLKQRSTLPRRHHRQTGGKDPGAGDAELPDPGRATQAEPGGRCSN